MTMLELAIQYRSSAETLSERIVALQILRRKTQDLGEQCRLAARIEMLSTMQRENRELAVLMERYYDRGYHKNGKYTL